jgi:hypothetical protein
MNTIKYFPEVKCTVTSSDLYNTQVVGIPDETGNSHFLRVAQGAVKEFQGQHYLPVGIVEVDESRQRALIQLPYEADSGANRLWIPFSNFRAETTHKQESEILA